VEAGAHADAGDLAFDTEGRLIPFDNLIWDRDRTRRVHDFRYSYEACKAAYKRVYGQRDGCSVQTGRSWAEWIFEGKRARWRWSDLFAEPHVDESRAWAPVWLLRSLRWLSK
jgi:hypothetical protein